MLEIAVLYGCDLSQVFTPIILRLYQPHSLCEKGATRAAAKAALYVFLLAPLHEGRREPDALQRDHDGHFYERRIETMGKRPRVEAGGALIF